MRRIDLQPGPPEHRILLDEFVARVHRRARVTRGDTWRRARSTIRLPLAEPIGIATRLAQRSSALIRLIPLCLADLGRSRLRCTGGPQGVMAIMSSQLRLPLRRGRNRLFLYFEKTQSLVTLPKSLVNQGTTRAPDKHKPTAFCPMNSVIEGLQFENDNAKIATAKTLKKCAAGRSRRSYPL